MANPHRPRWLPLGRPPGAAVTELKRETGHVGQGQIHPGGSAGCWPAYVTPTIAPLAYDGDVAGARGCP